MDLSSAGAEALHGWLLREFTSEKGWLSNLPSRINTGALYNQYVWWCDREELEALPLPDLWCVIQLTWPWVTIFGYGKGNRYFTCLRRKQ